MACACKNKTSNGQVTAVKQVVKKTTAPKTTTETTQKKLTSRRILFKRPM